jgi:hypothetical protein
MVQRATTRLVRGTIGTLFGFSLLGGMFIPLLILLWQILAYLRDGIWSSISVGDSLVAAREWLPTDVVSWVIQPASWFGLHQIVVPMPMALAIFVVGFGLALLICCSADKWRLWDDSGADEGR